jgi:uncharacterized cupredoxin-like copper-binding protein
MGAALLLIAACGSSGAANWTYAPPTTTPAPSASASPTASATASASETAGSSASPSASAAGGSGDNVIDLTETADLRIVDASGQQATSIKVTKGQTYTFNITNTAGFDHDFYIGADADLQAGTTAALTGLPAFSSGTKTFTYTFDSDGPLNFGCTIPGHYTTMHGTFDIGS